MKVFRNWAQVILPLLVFVILQFFFVLPAWAETEGFYEYYINSSTGGAVIQKYTGDEINCIIPSKIKGHNVYKLDSFSFSGKVYMQSVKIPNTVQEIGGWAFQGCTALKSVVIPDSVTSISGSFEGCTALQSVVVGKGVVELDSALNEGAFEGCTALTSVTLSRGLEVIGSETFRGCTALPAIHIPDTVKVIGYKAFNGCDSLKELIIPDSVTTIKSGDWESEASLGNCASLQRIVLGKNVEGTLYGCRSNPSLTSVEFRGNKISEIGNNAFSKNPKLTSITLPSGVEFVGHSAFSDCTSLTSVKLNEGIGYIDRWCFEGCTALQTITIPSSVCNFGENVFSGCSSLKTVMFKPCFNANEYKTNIIGPYRGSGLVVSCYGNSQFKEDLQADGSDRYDPFTVREMAAVPSRGITLSKRQVSLVEGQMEQVSAALSPANTTDSVCWTSSNNKIATVSQAGLIRAVGYGSAVITVQTNSGAIAQLNVTCQKAPTKLEISVAKKTLAVKQTLSIKAKVDGGARTDVAVKWKSSNDTVATVSSKGKVTAKKAGSVTITAYTDSGLTAVCKVTVKKAPTKITVKKSLTLKKGKSKTLKYTLSKRSYTSKVTWKSSNKKVASVSSKGKVTAKKKGKCKITVKTHNGKKATCTVKVK